VYATADFNKPATFDIYLVDFSFIIMFFPSMITSLLIFISKLQSQSKWKVSGYFFVQKLKLKQHTAAKNI